MAPEKLAGVYLADACKVHDLDYSKAGKETSRDVADTRLRDNIIIIYKSKNKAFLGYIIGYIYYVFVRIFGGFYWKTW